VGVMECIKFNDIMEGHIFQESLDYAVEFEAVDDALREKALRIRDVFSWVGESLGILNFHNFVGNTEFLGKKVRVQSKKITEENYVSMLFEITGKIAQLPFDFNTPTYSHFEINHMDSGKILYHTYLILRYMVFNSENDIQSAYEAIFSNPSRKTERVKSKSNVWEIKDVSFATIDSMLNNPQNLVKLNSSSSLNNTAFAKRCARNGIGYFPGVVDDVRIIKSFDTAENRFIKYFLELCLSIVYMFEEKLINYNNNTSRQMPLNLNEIFGDINKIREILQSIIQNPMFDEVGELRSIPFDSPLLQKGQGYKDIFNFYNILQSSIYFPISNKKLELIIENKDIAELYEIWTYFRMLDVLEDVIGIEPSKAFVIREDDFKKNMNYSTCVVYNYQGRTIKLWYNKTYSRGHGSYSLQLRPDIVLEVDNIKYIFDAKFKIDTVNWDDLEEEKTFTFKNGDIYKMHTYKDAIDGVKTACILYPNPAKTCIDFFYEDINSNKGVGAIPMLPDLDMQQLRDFLSEFCLK
jgi:predicted component of viral defense system (DUF524 family)